MWQRGAAAALVSIKPGQGYDFAYPTKVLSALGCGTPVLFAGRGPVSADVRDFDLGWAAEHDAAAVAEAMRTNMELSVALSDPGYTPEQRGELFIGVIFKRMLKVQLVERLDDAVRQALG